MMDFTDMFKSEEGDLGGYLGSGQAKSSETSDAPDSDRADKGPGGLTDNMNFINHSLRTYGLPSPLPFGSSDDRDVGIVLDAVYRLLQQRRSDAATVDSLRHRVTREERENARLRAEREQAQGRYAALDQSKALLEARMGKQKTAFAREKAALEQRVEQLEKRCLQLQHRDAQYLAAAKRQEREFARLQKQLKTAAGARDRDTKQRMELAQKLQAPAAAGGARRGWKAARGTAKEDLAASLVASYEEREKAFLAENDQLRGTLRALQEELCGAIAAHKRAHASMRQREAEAEAAIERAGAVAPAESDHAAAAASGGDDLEIEVLPTGQFALPLDWAKDSVVSALRAQAGRLAQLARAVDANGASQPEPAPTEPAAGAARELQAVQSRAVKLEASLARAKAIIRDQDVLLRAALLEGPARDEPGPTRQGPGGVAWRVAGSGEDALRALAAAMPGHASTPARAATAAASRGFANAQAEELSHARQELARREEELARRARELAEVERTRAFDAATEARQGKVEEAREALLALDAAQDDPTEAREDRAARSEASCGEDKENHAAAEVRLLPPASRLSPRPNMQRLPSRGRSPGGGPPQSRRPAIPPALPTPAGTACAGFTPASVARVFAMDEFSPLPNTPECMRDVLRKGTPGPAEGQPTSPPAATDAAVPSQDE